MNEIELGVVRTIAQLENALHLVHRTGPSSRVSIEVGSLKLIEFLERTGPVQSLMIQCYEDEIEEEVEVLNQAVARFLEREMTQEFMILSNESDIGIPHVSRSFRLRKLGFYFPSDDMDRLPNFLACCAASLESLTFHFSGDSLGVNLPEVARALDGAENLRELVIGKLDFVENPGLHELVTSLPRLESLKITKSIYTCPDGPTFWNGLRGHPGLTRISLIFEDIHVNDLELFTEVLFSMPNLQVVDFNPGDSWNLDLIGDEEYGTEEDAKRVFRSLLRKFEVIPGPHQQAVFESVYIPIRTNTALASVKSRVGRQSPLRVLPRELLQLTGTYLI